MFKLRQKTAAVYSFILFTAVAYSSLSLAVATVGKPAPEFSLKDGDKKAFNLADYKAKGDFKGKHVVLEWYNKDCPYVRNHYDTNNMQKLQAKYKGKVAWLTIVSSAPEAEGYMTDDVAKKQLTVEKSNADALLIDADGKVGKAYGAKTTPHMYVIDPAGTLVYAGAIDDMAKPTGDHSKAVNYVANALEAELSTPKKPVAVSSTKAYGCGVKYK